MDWLIYEYIKEKNFQDDEFINGLWHGRSDCS